MAITRYAGDRFTIAAGDTKPTGVLDGAVLIDTGNLELFIKRDGSWVEVTGAGSDAVPGDPLNSVQFNNNGAFGGDADLTFTDGNRLNVNKLGISGNVYDSNNWIGEGGMILANEGATGINWKNIESVLSGVGGSGVANYVARWSDEDTLTTGALVDDGTKVGIGTASPAEILEVVSDSDPTILIRPVTVDSANSGKISYRENAGGTTGVDLRYDGNVNKFIIDTSDVTNALVIKRTDGRVGIGTNTPNELLEIFSTGTNTDAKIRLSSSGNTTGGRGIEFFDGAYNRWRIATVGANGNFEIHRSTTGNSWEAVPAISINKADGNVGIGTTAPAGRLHIETTGNEKSLWIAPSAATTTNVLHLEADSLTTGSAVYIHSNNYNTGTRKLVYINNDHASATGTTALYINQDSTGPALVALGNVGIGTAVVGANQKLDVVFVDDVNGAGVTFRNTDGSLQFQNVAGSASQFNPQVKGNSKHVNNVGLRLLGNAASGEDSGTTPLILLRGTVNNAKATTRPVLHIEDGDGTKLVSVAADGNVGINTILPEHKLHVSGDAIISGVLYDSTNSSGVSGHVLTSEVGGPQWKMIEDVLSGVGGNGTANYVPKWEDSDTIGDSVISQSGSNIGINMTAANPATELHIGSLAAPAQGGNWASLSIGEDNYPERRTQINAYRSLRGGDWDHMGISFQPHTSSSHLEGPTITGMAIDYDGYVGIGTNEPYRQLDVYNATASGYANIAITAATDGQSSLWLADTADGNIGGLCYYHSARAGASANSMDFRVNDATRMTIISDGNVGIGTTAPGAILDARGDTHIGSVSIPSTGSRLYVDGPNASRSNLAHFYNNDMGHNSNVNIWIGKQSAADKAFSLGYHYDNTAAARYAWIIHYGDSPGAGMNWLKGGKVGIGTVAPAAKLDVIAHSAESWEAIRASGSVKYYTSTSDGSELRYAFNMGGASDGAYQYLYKGDASTIGISLNAGGATYFNGGSVGIGNAAPVELLHVGKGESSVHGQILISADSGLHHYLRLTNGGGTSTHYPTGIWYAPSGRMELRAASGASTSNVAQLVLAADGNVGIGTTTPSMTLEVAGQMLLKSSSPEFDWVDTGAASNEGRWRADVNNSGTWALKSTNDAVSDSNDAISITRSGYVPQYVNFPNGKVGIGTTAPSKLLTVNPSTAGDGIYLLESDSANPCMQFYAYSNYGIFTMYERGDPQNTISTKLDGGGGGVVFNEKGYAFDFRIEGDTDQNLFFLDGSTDKIGIGTDAPVELLTVSAGTTGDVVGELALQGHRTGNHPFGKINFYHGATATAFVLGTRENSQDNSGGLMFNTMNAGTEAERVRISYDGTLDIKSAKLKINGSGGSAGQTLTTDGSGNISWSAAGSGTISGSGTDNYVPRFNGTNAIQNSAIFSNDSGSVGIGTNAPHQPLHVHGGTEANLYVREGSAFGSANGAGLQSFNDANSSYLPLTFAASKYFFYGGNVGIGTTAPGRLLHLYTSSHAYARIQSSATNKNAAVEYYDGTNWMYAGLVANEGGGTGNWAVITGTGSKVGLSVKQDGNVGIGTNAPSEKLEVVGKMLVGADSTISPNHADSSIAVEGTGDNTIIGLQTSDGYRGEWVLAKTLNDYVAGMAAGDSMLASHDTRALHLGDYNSIFVTISDSAGSGKVGIGTVAPAALLHLKGGTATNEASHILFENTQGAKKFAIGGGGSGVTNNGLGFRNVTDNTLPMIISDSGKVGIGTTSPDEKLDVAGNIMLSVASSFIKTYAGDLYLAPDSSNVTIYGTGAGAFNVYDNSGTSALRVKLNSSGDSYFTGGDVGIGTNAPGKLLTLSSTNAQLMLNESDQSSDSQNWLFNAEGGTLYFQALGGTAGSVTSGSTWMQAVRSGTTISSVSFPSSDVGIGTAAPGYPLTVKFDGAVSYNGATDLNGESIMSLEGTDADQEAVMIRWANNGNMNNYFGVVQEGASAQGDFVWTSYGGSSLHYAERMRLTAGGKVGIGTTAPGAKLNVVGNVRLDGTTYASWFNYSSGEDTYIRGGKSSSKVHIADVGDDVLIANGGGNVGIGTTSPYAPLTTSIAATNTIATDDASSTAGIVVSGTSNLVRLQLGVGGSTMGPYGGWIQASYDNTGGADGVEPLLLNPIGGKVGIGTAVPVSPLHVKGTTNTNIISIGVGHADGSVRSHWGYDAGGNTTGFIVGTAYNSNAAKFQIRMKGTASSDAKVTILGDGKVGIGTAAPQESLTISGNFRSNANEFRIKRSGTDIIYHSGATMKLSTSNTAALTIDSSQRVGIGTTAPSNRLEVNGNISFTAGDSLEWNNNAGTRINASHGSAFMSFDVAGTSAVLYLKPTAVGIGTNAPDQYAKLHTLTDGTDNQLRIEAHRNDVGQTSVRGYFSRGSAASPVIVQNNDTIFEAQGWGYDGTNHWRVAEIDFQVDGTPGTNDMPGRLVFSTTADGATAPTERMRIGSDGTLNLISAKLKINGSGGTAGYHLQTDGSGNISWAAAGSGGGGTVTGTGTANYVSKWTGASSQGNSSVFDNGSVGISTAANLNSVLNVYGGTSSGPTSIITCMSANATVGGGAGIFFKSSNNHSLNRYGAQISAIRSANDNGSPDLVFRLEASDVSGMSERMRIVSEGNVGIGTTAPGSYKLRVQGDVYISGTLTEASSLAIKENIETYSPSLEKINKIRPVRYNKKKSKKKEVGLVAEELAEMFPELVETDEKGNPSGVNYSRAVAVLLHGFKELYKEVKELKEKI